MKKLALVIAPLIVFCATAFGWDDPTLVVIGGKLIKADKVVNPIVSLDALDPVDIGEIVIMQPKLSGELPDQVTKKTVNWEVTEGGYKKQFFGDGEKLIFGSGKKAATIKVVVKMDLTYHIGTEDIVKSVTATQNVTVGGVNPTPPTPTPPTPTPPAPAPDLTGLSKTVYDWVLTELTAIPNANVSSSAQAMATSFRQVAARIGNDTSVDNPRKILAATKTANNAALTAISMDPKSWDPWGLKLQDYLYAKYQSKELVTNDQYKAAWNQIAAGLEAIK